MWYGVREVNLKNLVLHKYGQPGEGGWPLNKQYESVEVTDLFRESMAIPAAQRLPCTPCRTPHPYRYLTLI